MWNSLPPALRENRSLATFKTKRKIVDLVKLSLFLSVFFFVVCYHVYGEIKIIKTENVSFLAFTMTLEDHPALLRRFRDSGAAI